MSYSPSECVAAIVETDGVYDSGEIKLYALVYMRLSYFFCLPHDEFLVELNRWVNVVEGEIDLSFWVARARQ